MTNVLEGWGGENLRGRSWRGQIMGGLSRHGGTARTQALTEADGSPWRVRGKVETGLT